MQAWAERFDIDWAPVSRTSLIAWLIFYAAFLVYALRNFGQFLFIDSANLVVHEGGHLLFGWFGSTIGLWGGTLLQWLAPLLLAAYFFTKGQTSAFVFCPLRLRTHSLLAPVLVHWFVNAGVSFDAATGAALDPVGKGEVAAFPDGLVCSTAKEVLARGASRKPARRR